MSNPYSNIRVGLDWERKGFICWGASPGDALNLIPVFAWPVLTGSTDLVASYKASPEGIHDPQPVYFDLTVDPLVGGTATFYGPGTYHIPLSASTTYTFGVYYETDVPVHTGELIVALNIFSSASPLTTAYYTATAGDSGGWLRGEYDTTFGGDSASLTVELSPVASAAVTQVKVKAFMVTATTLANAPTYYNSGTETCLWDEITNYVQRVDISTGYSDRFNITPDEGVATVVLDNQGRNFTPREIAGVYPGAYDGEFFDIGKTIKIKGISTSGEQTLYTGEIKQIEVQAGSQRDRYVSATCEQGTKRMERHYGDIGIVPERTLVEHIKQVFVGSGVYSVWTYPFVRLDDPAYPLDYAVLYHPDYLLDTFGTGAITGNPGMNMDWPQALSQTIRDVLDFDGGLFFIDADGLCTFYSRDYLTTATPVSTWAYEDFSEDEYVYDSDLANDFTLDFESAPLSLDPTLVDLGSNTITIPVGVDYEITIVYDYAPGAQGFSWGNHISQTLEIRKHSDQSIIGSGVGISFVSELDTSGRTENSDNSGWGTQVTFRLYNYTGFEIDVLVTVHGEGCEPDAAEVTEHLISDSILKYNRYSKSYSNPFITDNDYADDFVAQKEAQLSYPSQYFKSLALTVGPNTADYLDTRLGDVIELTYEYQTESIDLPLIVVGKNINWQPQQLRLEFILGPVV